MTTTPTYTRHEAEQALGIKSRSAFHYLKSRYPAAFVVIKQGTDRGNPTLYDKQTLDNFIEQRNAYKAYTKLISNVINDPLGCSIPKKGKQP